MTDWYLCFIPAFFIVVLALVARRVFRSWSAPPAFFCLVWSLYVLVPLCLAPDYFVWHGAIWFILLACLSVCAGARLETAGSLPRPLAFKSIRPPRTDPARPPKRPKLTGTGSVIIVCVFLGGLATMLLLSSWGQGLGVFTSFDSLSKLGGSIAVSRYTIGYDQPISVRVLTLPVYFGCFVGGAHIALSRTTSGRLLGILPMVPAVLLASILTTKATVLFSLVSMVSAYLALRVRLTGGKGAIVSGRRLLVQGAAVVILAALMTLIQSIRYQAGINRLSGTWAIVRVCMCGHVSAFSTWLKSDGGRPVNPTGGAYTFAGAFDAFGISDRQQGLYDDPVFVSNEPPMNSNIYTIFRGLILDFTLPGALLVLFFSGYFGQRSFRLTATRRNSIPILVTFYCFTIWSFVASYAVYNSLLVSLFMFGCYSLLQPSFSATPVPVSGFPTGPVGATKSAMLRRASP